MTTLDSVTRPIYDVRMASMPGVGNGEYMTTAIKIGVAEWRSDDMEIYRDAVDAALRDAGMPRADHGDVRGSLDGDGNTITVGIPGQWVALIDAGSAACVVTQIVRGASRETITAARAEAETRLAIAVKAARLDRYDGGAP